MPDDVNAEPQPSDEVPLGACPMPHEWTDEEWIRLIGEMDPQADVSVAMRRVYSWRNP